MGERLPQEIVSLQVRQVEKLVNLLDNYKLPLGLCLVGLVLIIGGIFASGLTRSKPKEFPEESLVQAQKIISVDISGAVNKPGVYKLNGWARIEDAINAAGGISQDASQEYVSKYINLAQKLIDGTKVYIPKNGEQLLLGQQAGSVSGVSTASSVNINNATQAELEALPGIGPVTASKIISDRPYQNTGELLSKKIVGKAVFEKIKDSIVVY